MTEAATFFDESLEGIVRVSVVATGIDNLGATRQTQPAHSLTELAGRLRNDSRRSGDPPAFFGMTEQALLRTRGRPPRPARATSAHISSRNLMAPRSFAATIRDGAFPSRTRRPPSLSVFGKNSPMGGQRSRSADPETLRDGRGSDAERPRQLRAPGKSVRFPWGPSA